MLEPIPIKRITAPTVSEFRNEYVLKSKPVIISGLVKEWKALSKWDLNFFAQNFGEVKTGSVRLKDGECDLNNYTGSRLDYVSLKTSLAAISEGSLQGGYAVASPTDVFPASLENDFQVPVYCANTQFLRSRIFIGTKGTITSLHQDLFENLYVMIKGTKRITLFAPSSPVYPNSRFSRLPNHAQVNPEKPDLTRFPKFQNAQSFTVDLSAGETLYLPSFWWHHLRNLDASIALSFWWARGWKLPLAWTAAMYKKLRKI